MSAVVSRERLLQLARLVCIHLTEEELDQLETQVNDIIDFVGQLREAPLQDIEESTHVGPAGGRMRDDECRPSLLEAEVLANAYREPVSGCFALPRVLGELVEPQGEVS
jgi:aspartyl-tRNA(Asn)/glutamyl-tRNA(Gln) amidotransferase subunit C